MLPKKQPQTMAEAEAILRELDLMPQNAVPAKAEILKYQERELLTFRSAVPFFPCEGPPLPRFTMLSWPKEVQNQIRIMKGKGKTVKHMLARFLPVSLPRVDVYVFTAKMNGIYTGSIENIGEVLLAAGNSLNWAKAKGYDLLRSVQSGNAPVYEGGSLEYTISFEITGWNQIQELWNYMWSRSIECTIRTDIHVDGYETADYTVDPYDKSFDVTAILPVKEMNWHSW